MTDEPRDGDRCPRRGHVRVESILRRRSQGRFHIVALGQMTCDAKTFFVEDEVHVTEGEAGDDREVGTKTWHRGAPRDFF